MLTLLKKTLYHFLPGTRTFSIAAAGCNFHCGFCQNWQILLVSIQNNAGLSKMKLSPGDIVDNAIDQHCKKGSYHAKPQRTPRKTIYFKY
jgi:pyruvate formate lyase activating enzyme